MSHEWSFYIKKQTNPKIKQATPPTPTDEDPSPVLRLKLLLDPSSFTKHPNSFPFLFLFF